MKNFTLAGLGGGVHPAQYKSIPGPWVFVMMVVVLILVVVVVVVITIVVVLVMSCYGRNRNVIKLTYSSIHLADEMAARSKTRNTAMYLDMILLDVNYFKSLEIVKEFTR